MKVFKIILIIGIILMGFLIWSLVKPGYDIDNVPRDDGPDTTYSTSTTSNTKDVPVTVSRVRSLDGRVLQVNDFLNNGTTVTDPSNINHFILAGDPGICLPDNTCPRAYNTEDFYISYNYTDDYFSIVLLKEPFGVSRLFAQEFMENELGLEPEQMCGLNYSLMIPMYVSETYAGVRLKFSHCPGAVEL